MKVTLTLNGRERTDEVRADTTLYEYVRSCGCLSVKCGCDTSSCGLCTVWLDGKPVLSCSVLALQAQGKCVTTLEGLPEEVEVLGGCLADEGVEQCGFCSPGLMMNILAMVEELSNPTEEEILEYLVGNLCRCSGYQGQMRAIQRYLIRRGGKES